MLTSNSISSHESAVRGKTAPLLEVSVPTATAVIHDSSDPYLVLVGQSKKHEKPVLPGGKIDKADLASTSIAEAALTCISRELFEEIGVTACCLKVFGIREERDSDVRTIVVSALRESLAAHFLADASDDALVFARYGVPDYLFVGVVDPSLVHSTDELAKLSWIDCRTVNAETLGAGHHTIIDRYLKYLEQGQSI